MSKGLKEMLQTAKSPASAGAALLKIPVGELHPIETQDRKTFDPQKLDELAASFSERIQKGKIPNIEPLQVHQAADGRYMIEGGERRWRAAKQLGYTGPLLCVVNDGEDKNELSDVMFLSNYAREDLNLVELSHAVGQRIDDGTWDRNKAMSMLGYGKSALSKILAIRTLPDDVQQLCLDGVRTDKDFLIDLGRLPEEPRLEVIEKLRAGTFDHADAQDLKNQVKEVNASKAKKGEKAPRKATKLSLRATQLRVIVAECTAVRKAMKPYCQAEHKHANLDSISDGDFVEYFSQAIQQLGNDTAGDQDSEE